MMRTVALLASLVFGSPAIAQTAASPVTPPAQYILVEPTTWTVLAQNEPAQTAPIASMTKMMTALIIVDHLRQGKLNWEDPVATSAKASRMGGSQVYLRHREVFSVREMMAALVIHSANDAAMALAEHVAGDEAQFVPMMNVRARELGLADTQFYSPHGLPEEGGLPDDVSSPRDMAKLGWTILQIPEMRQLITVKTRPFRDGKFTLYNPNDLLNRYPAAIGIKTGTHDRAGSCVTAAAEKNGMTLIAVVMGAQQRSQLFRDVEQLFENAFEKYEIVEPVKRGQSLPDELPVRGGRVPTVRGVAAADARVIVEKDQPDVIATQLQLTNPPAPVRQGERVGWIIVQKEGRAIGRVPVVATVAVPEQSLLQRFWDHVWPW